MKINGIPLKSLLFFIAAGFLITLFPQPAATTNGYFETLTTPNTPSLLYPADSTYRVQDLPTFIWSSSDSADSYEIQITSDPTFYYINIDSAGITDTSFTVTTPLSHGSPYYWRVRAKNVQGNSTYTYPFMFVVSVNGVNGPQIPIPTYPISGAYIYSDTAVMRWQLSYADSSLVYDIDVSRDSTFSTIDTSISGDTGDSFTGDGFMSDSIYYWKIRSRDIIHPDTSAFSPLAYFHVSKSHTHPILSWPIGGGYVYQTTQTLSWFLNGPAPGITFDITLSLNSNLSSPDTTATGLTSRFFTVDNLMSGYTYYWQVISHVPGFTDSSAIDSFYVVSSAGPVVPTLSWPVGGNYVYSNIPTLNWYINSTGTGLTYDVRYALDTASLNTAPVYSTTNVFYTVGTPLLSDTTYYWQVRSRNGTQVSAFSAPDSFIVALGSGNPVVPVPSNPVNGNTVYTNNPLLSWYLNTAPTGLSFQVRYSHYIDSLNNATLYTGDTSWSYSIVLPLPFDSIYYWQVRSKSATDSSSFSPVDSFMVMTGNGNPPVPIPSWPIGGATVYPNPPLLSWYINIPLNSLLYEVQFSSNSDMSGATTTVGLDSNQFQIPVALTAGATFYWRVRTYSSLLPDTSAWSSTQTFVTASNLGPVTPRIGGPSSGVQVNTTDPMLSWYLPTKTGNVTYEMQYSKNPDLSQAITISNLSNAYETLSGLTPGENYYWRVRSLISGNKYSGYSPIGHFVSANVTGVENSQVPLTFSVSQNYPNPFNPSTTIEYTIPKNEMVVIKIYNILGQKIKTLINNEMKPGKYSMIWNGDNNFDRKVATGVYIYRVTAGVNVKTMKMILLK